MSTISKLNVDAIIDKSITSDKLADDFMLLSDALENEEVTAAALTELNNTKADKTAIDEITQALATKADGEVVSALQQDLDSKVDPSELSNYLPLSGGILTGNFQINGKLTIPGLESNNDYIESVRYVNGLWGTESGKSPEMTHDLASIKNAIKFNWYNDDWIIGNIRAGSASSDGFGIGMEKTKSDGTTIYQKNIFRLSPDGEIYLNGTPLANKYLSLSGGKMTGAISGLTSLTSAGNITATEYGFRFSSTQYDGYIWNTEAGKGVAIGVIDNGSANLANASLIIKGSNIYPGTSNKFSLGTDSYKFKDIYADGIVKGSRFLGGTKTKAEIESDTNPGLSISTTIGKDSFTNNYGLSVSDSANGVLAFRSHNGSGADYISYLGFTQKGLYYRNSSATATADNWVKLNNPSILSISVPEIEYSSSPKILPEILNDNICNIFHDIPKTQILIERSQNGTTWTDTTETDYPKFKQVMSSGKGAEVPVVAYDGANGQVGDRVRITINGAAAYAKLSHLYVYYTTLGNTTKLTVEKNSYGDQNTWTTLIDKQSCAGWSGPNYYGLNNSYFGRTGGNGGYSYRLTFEITAITSGQTNIGYLNNIWAFSSDRPWSKTGNPTEMFYFNTNRWKFVTNKSIEPLYDVTSALGSSNYRWSSIYAKDFYGTNFYGTAQKATQDGSGNTITSTYAKLASNNVFTEQQKVVYNGRATLIKNGSIGFIDPNTSSWAYAISMFDTTGENYLANICGAKGGNNKVQYVYMGGTYDKPWLKVTPTGGLTSPFIGKTSGNILNTWTRNLCNHTAIYGSSPTHNSCVIKTGIPVSTSKLYQMHVYGYNYQAGGQVDFTIGFLMYNGSPLRVYGVSNGTLTNPHYYIGKYTEDGVEKVCVYWTCDDSTGNNQQHYVMVDALDSSNTWSIEEYTTEVAATITSMTEASLHERMTLNKAETVTGNKTFTGAFNANTNINIGSSYGINFNRNDYNYINIPTGDYSALAICKGGMSGANTLYVMNGSALFPYNNNNNDLGTSAKTWKNVYAAKFITTGGTASQVVLGDGTLKNVSELGSSSLTYATLSNTNIINAGFNYNNTYSGLTIDTYTGFTMDTPDTVIVSAYPITFSGSIMKMEGIENLSGTYYIYCLSYMANGLIAINGAVYN